MMIGFRSFDGITLTAAGFVFIVLHSFGGCG